MTQKRCGPVMPFGLPSWLCFCESDEKECASRYEEWMKLGYDEQRRRLNKLIFGIT